MRHLQVVLAGREVVVEVFVVVGLLFDHQRASGQQEGEAVGGYRAVHAQLVLVLPETAASGVSRSAAEASWERSWATADDSYRAVFYLVKVLTCEKVAK